MKFFVSLLVLFFALEGLHPQTPSWHPVGSIGGDIITSIVTDGHGIIYTIFNDTTFLYKSSDNGNHWFTIGLKGIRCVAIISKSTILISSRGGGTNAQGIYKSIDGGKSFVQISGSFIPDDIKVASDTLIYGCDYYGRNLSYSSDAGNTWKRISGVPISHDDFSPLSVGPNGEIYLQNICSIDNGKTWKKCSDSVEFSYGKYSSLRFMKSAGEIQFAENGKCFGLFYAYQLIGNRYIFCESNDCGKNWSLVPGFHPASDTEITSFQVGKNGNIYVFDRNGSYAFHSTDYGETWSNFLPIDYEPVASTLDSSGNPIVATVTNLYFYDKESGRWIGKGPSIGIVFKIAADKKGNLVSSISYHNNFIQGYIDAQGFYVLSTDGGVSWTSLFASNGIGPRKGSRVSDIAIDSTNKIIVAPSYGFYSTSDLGKTWQYKLEGNVDGGPVSVDSKGNAFVSNDLPFITFLDTNEFYEYHKEISLGLDASSGEIFGLCSNVNGFLFTSTRSGVYRLAEGDYSWSKCNIPYSSKPIKVLFSISSGYIFLGTEDQGILRSTNNGIDWGVMNSGLPDISITSLIGDSYGNIYAAEGKGVCILKPQSNSWEDISTGLEVKDIRSLAWTNKDELFAGTNGKGVYKLATSTFKRVSEIVTTELSIFVRYNRASEKIEIQSSSNLGPTNTSLYSIDGRLLKRTKLNISAAGEYSIDVSDVHTHFAFLVLQTGKGVSTRKLLLSEP
jgi:photosystem II stability/assembly factor-like uncharacterized protein